MIPNPGEVYLVDMGYDGKTRPVIVVSRMDADAPRALAVVVPLTTQNRGSRYEVTMPKVPWLKHASIANVQALATYGHHELLERRGRFEPPAMSAVKDAIRWALDI